MLEQLIVKDFALSESNSIDFDKGMISITGETGAGKSLTVDALGMVLGERADADMVRSGAAKAEIEAVFSIGSLPELKEKLNSLELGNEDDLLLRRVINSDGKSKAYINGHPCTLGLLKEVGAFLVAIHGQHASIRLVDEKNQLELLDAYGADSSYAQKTAEAFNSYNAQRQKLSELAEEQKKGAGQFKTLRYELEELNKLDLGEGDYEEISARYDALMNASQAQNAIGLALGLLDNDEHNILEIISARISDLEKVKLYNEEKINPVLESLHSAASELDNARELLAELDTSVNPAQVEELSDKLSKCHDMAHRFGVQPKDLYKVTADLELKLEHLLSLKGQISTLTEEVKKLRAEYEDCARELSLFREKCAKDMSTKVTAKIKDLAIPDGVFIVECRRDEDARPRRDGRDQVSFLFSANLGDSPKALGSVASGGELSRLALAIEVLTSSQNRTPTLIFDEVDTGISGRTASSVGSLLRELGQHVQVLTVTHLPQVAAKADHQFLVQKDNTSHGVVSKITELKEQGRVDEIARMMGGNVVTEATLEGAKALLADR